MMRARRTALPRHVDLRAAQILRALPFGAERAGPASFALCE